MSSEDRFSSSSHAFNLMSRTQIAVRTGMKSETFLLPMSVWSSLTKLIHTKIQFVYLKTKSNNFRMNYLPWRINTWRLKKKKFSLMHSFPLDTVTPSLEKELILILKNALSRAFHNKNNLNAPRKHKLLKTKAWKTIKNQLSKNLSKPSIHHNPNKQEKYRTTTQQEILN